MKLYHQQKITMSEFSFSYKILCMACQAVDCEFLTMIMK